MNQAKTSSKINSIFRAVATAAVLPVLFIYIMVAKPDYKIMNMLSYIVLPVAEFVGDVVTWPFRAVGNLIENISLTLSNSDLIKLKALLEEFSKVNNLKKETINGKNFYIADDGNMLYL